MILPDAPWRQWPGLDKLLATLGAGEGDTRFVGGCVRDTLLKLEVSDVDLATRLAPKEVMTRLKRGRIKAVPTGLAHGTVTAVIQSRPIQITTLRRDVATDGRRATIAYTDDWREDAARRDFTINALSAEPASGAIHDYFEGEADIEARRVRFIGDPLTRIAEDHLRILRFFRFHARFGEGAPDAVGLGACAARANDLMALSRERIADELLKLLALPDPASTVALMIERGIFQPVIPEIEISALPKLIRLVRREDTLCIAPRAITRLSALLPANPEMAASIAARLRLSNGDRRLLATYADTWKGDMSARQVRGGTSLFEYEVVDLLLLSDLDDKKVAEEIASVGGWERPVFPLKGGDLIAMGLAPGPVVAQVLNDVRWAWVQAGFPDKNWVRRAATEAIDQALRSSQ